MFTQQVAHVVSLIAIALGVFLLLFAIFGYLITIKTLELEDTQPTYLFYPILTGAVILYGFFSLLIIFLMPY